jgi:hypothetical protein
MFKKIVDTICIVILIFVVPVALVILTSQYFKVQGVLGYLAGIAIYGLMVLCVLRVYYIGKRGSG